MATPRMDITSFVGKLLEQDDVDALREGVRVLAQAVMETEVSTQIGAAPYERSSERVAYRNGYRTRTVGHPGRHDRAQDPEGDRRRLLPLAARASPARREGPARGRRRGLREGRLHPQGRRPGAGARDRRDLPLGGLPDLQGARRGGQGVPRPPDRGECPYLWLDATFHKVREAGRVISVATVVAIGVTDQGERTVLGARDRAERGPPVLDVVPAPARQARPEGRAPGDLRRPRGPAPGDREGPCTRPPGSGAACTSCGTCSRPSPSRPRTPWPRSSARSSPSPTTPRR